MSNAFTNENTIEEAVVVEDITEPTAEAPFAGAEVEEVDTNLEDEIALVPDTLVEVIKKRLVFSAIATIFEAGNIDLKPSDGMVNDAVEIFNNPGADRFIKTFVVNTHRIIEDKEKSVDSLGSFIATRLMDIPDAEQTPLIDYFNDVISKLSDENRVSTSTLTDDQASAVANLSNCIVRTDDTITAIIWLSQEQLLVLTANTKGEEFASTVLFTPDNSVVAMYTPPQPNAIIATISTNISKDCFTFKIKAEGTDKKQVVTADTLTLEVFKELANTDGEIYARLKEEGNSDADAYYATGIEEWAAQNDVDLATTAINIPHLEDITAYVREKYGISTPQEEPTSNTTDSSIPDTDAVDGDAFVNETVDTDDDTVEPDSDAAAQAQTPVKKEDTLVTVIKTVANKWAEGEGHLLSVASATARSPRVAFSEIIKARVSATYGPIHEDQMGLVDTTINSVFESMLPRIDNALEEYRNSIENRKIEVNTETVAEIIYNSDTIHKVAIPRIDDLTVEEVASNIVPLKELQGYEKGQEDLLEVQVIEILDSIAPYNYDARVLTDKLYASEKVANIDSNTNPYRSVYIGALLELTYKKQNAKQIGLDTNVIEGLMANGDSTSIFHTENDVLKDIVQKLGVAGTYTFSNNLLVLLASREDMLVSEDDNATREQLLYSILGEKGALNFVVSASTDENGDTTYNIVSARMYSGVENAEEYCNNIRIYK